MRYFLIFFCLILLISTVSAFKFYREVTIVSNSEMVDVLIMFWLDIEEGKMREDCGDLRIIDGDKKTMLPYYIDCNPPRVEILVRIPSLPLGNKTIYIVYGDPRLTSESNASAVSDLYEDFIDISDWSITNWGTGYGSVTAENGKMKLMTYKCHNVEAVKQGRNYSQNSILYLYYVTRAQKDGEFWNGYPRLKIFSAGVEILNHTFSSSHHDIRFILVNGSVKFVISIEQSEDCNSEYANTTILEVYVLTALKLVDPPLIVVGEEREWDEWGVSKIIVRNDFVKVRKPWLILFDLPIPQDRREIVLPQTGGEKVVYVFNEWQQLDVLFEGDIHAILYTKGKTVYLPLNTETSYGFLELNNLISEGRSELVFTTREVSEQFVIRLISKPLWCEKLLWRFGLLLPALEGGVE